IYARALNNLDREEEGLAALLSVRDEGENDGLWHYRVAYSLYYTDRAEEALVYATRAHELGGYDWRTYGLKQIIESSLGIETDE
ncbi:MAG: hypothetical protein LBP28_03400, partial [Coriobacteriales bacterium]|nr:hypothetical protein [Coriobacteriales bacterium]